MATTTWTLSNGQKVEVEARGNGSYRVLVAGDQARDGRINDRAPVPAAAAQAGIVTFLVAEGRQVGLTAERRDALAEMDREATAEDARARAEEIELGRLLGALADAGRDLTEHGYGATGARGQAVERAREALATWATAHPAAYAAHVATQQAGATARKAERAEGVARALRGED